MDEKLHLEGNFILNEQPDIEANFNIQAAPIRLSQLENDLNYQTGEQVAESITEAAATINERIDGVVDTFDSEIEDINTRMIDTVSGSDLIGVSRVDNTVTLTSQTYVFEQAIASDAWVINHNLNKAPSIYVVDSAGHMQIPDDIKVDDLNTITIKFIAGFSGTAYLN